MSDINEAGPDRTGWPAGRWDAEGDREEWRDETTGMVCIAHRGPSGNWCGYVGVPAGHPWHGTDYEHIDVDVHGGLTYADRCRPEIGICHVPRPGEPEELYWVGFDCGHAWDIVPRVLAALPEERWTFPDAVYRDLEYVGAECASLAAQAEAAER